MNTPPIVSPQEWQTAWENMLVKEKELTRGRDALAAERRRMPWLAVEKDYRFEGPDGPVSLLDLFEGRRQLVRRLAPLRAGCPHVSRGGRRVPGEGLRGLFVRRGPGGASCPSERPGHDARVRPRDTQAEIQGLKERMGWQKTPGTRSPTTSTPTSALTSGTARMPSSVKARRSSARTSSTAAATRRWETWAYLDITALGRQEEWEASPEGYPQTPPYGWWNYRDAYGKET